MEKTMHISKSKMTGDTFDNHYNKRLRRPLQARGLGVVPQNIVFPLLERGADVQNV